MCRVAVRQPPRHRPEDLKVEPAAVSPDSLAQLQAQSSALNIGLESDEIDFDNLFEDDNDPELGAGELDLLALFSDDSDCTAEQAQQSSAAVVEYPVQGQPVNGMPVVAPVHGQAAPGALQQLQMQALLRQQQQQQLAVQQQAYVAPQDMAQLHQLQAAQMQAMLAAQAQLRAGQPVNKRGKTQAEVEEQQERIKKRRRESAQRSRARKNSYMKTLEVENKALKMENERLRMELAKMSQKTGSTSSCRIGTPPQQQLISDYSEGLSVSGDGAPLQQLFSVPSTAHAGSFFHMPL